MSNPTSKELNSSSSSFLLYMITSYAIVSTILAIAQLQFLRGNQYSYLYVDKGKGFISLNHFARQAKTHESWVESQESYSTSGQAAFRCFQMSRCQDSQSDHVPSDTAAAGRQAAVSYKCLSG